jgi:hypothetical protein
MPDAAVLKRHGAAREWPTPGSTPAGSLFLMTTTDSHDTVPEARSNKFIKHLPEEFLRPDEGLDFFRYTSARLTSVEHGRWDASLGISPPTNEAMEAARTRLYVVASPTSVFPAIAPDGDGGLEIVWRASGKELNLAVTEDGVIHVWADRNLGTTFEAGTEVTSDIYTELMQVLSELTSQVERLNPNWRRQFDI